MSLLNSMSEVVIDDGHKPNGLSHIPTKLVYQTKSFSHFLSVKDNLLQDIWLSRAHEYSKLCKGNSWGEYVSTSEVVDWCNDIFDIEDLYATNPKKAIAIVTTKALLFDKSRLPVEDIISQVDVTAVWCLSSGVTNEVEYHIDYAELYRYETNIIQPPLFAGTCHLSPFTSKEDMTGGDFMANTRGLDHYLKFGYKGKLSSPEELQEDLKSSDWIKVPYKCNRGIVHDGDYPHLSTAVTHLGDSTARRVILGFNCFPAGAVAECTRRAPEHSDAFRRTVKLYQTVSSLVSHNSDENNDHIHFEKATDDMDHHPVSAEQSIDQRPDTSSPGNASKVKSVLTLNEIKKNPFLAKLIVRAAKSYKEKNQPHQTSAS